MLPTLHRDYNCCPGYKTCRFAILIHFIRGKGRGRPKESQVVPDPRLQYGQVIKQRTGRRLVSVTRRVVFGLAKLIPLRQISTSLLECLNGTIRQHVIPLHRNLCRKHSTLKGKTPAQAAGLSDHCRTLRELLTFNAAISSKIVEGVTHFLSHILELKQIKVGLYYLPPLLPLEMNQYRL
jgi:hypothetical protein